MGFPSKTIRKSLYACAFCAIIAFSLSGCGSSGSSGTSGGSTSASSASASPATSAATSAGSQASGADEGQTSGPPFTKPRSVAVATFDLANAQTAGSGVIDTSNSSKGYVGAEITSPSRCKFQVVKGEMTYNYDIPSDGTPIIVPMNMGSGTYTFRLMQNTSGSSYVEVGSLTADVALETEFEPYLHPDIFCQYDATSECVAQAFSLASGCENEGDVARAIYDWMVHSITYDTTKASELASTSGYIPMPDDTLSSGTGICFDYASLAAAMFRSLGIPCQIITGYVGAENLYHAWNMVYLDGEWVSAQITIQPDTWCRVDLTFAASNGDNSTFIGDGTTYTDRYIY